MSRLEIILSASLFLSIIFNVGFFVYARNVVAKLLFVSEELGDLQNMTDSFAKHLKNVYELEMFYGDETLRHLLNHAISFNEQLLTFEEIYSLTEEENVDDKQGRIEEDPAEEAEDEDPEAFS
jgi:hypothetical protein|tara:strand:+ start:494 stop:862 length:369 start_codon:yes stop_codon:yes gene_type:complete